MGLWVLLLAAEAENYLSWCDTLISLHLMRLCSVLCTNGSAVNRPQKRTWEKNRDCVHEKNKKSQRLGIFTDSKYLQENTAKGALCDFTTQEELSLRQLQ